MLNAKQVPSTGGSMKIEPLEAGTYPARLVSVVLLGKQAQQPYKGEEKPPRLDINLTYELLDEFLEDEEGNILEDKPRWFSETIGFYNLEADQALSTKRYFALDPTSEHDGDLAALLGTPCNVTLSRVTVKSGKNAGKETNRITNISGMRSKDAAKAPELVNPPIVFDPYDPDMEEWGKLNSWIKDQIKSALDFEEMPLFDLVKGEETESEKSEKKDAKKKAGKPKAAEPEDSEDDDDEIAW